MYLPIVRSKSEIVEIKDNRGNAIKVPKYGSVTVREAIEIDKLRFNLSSSRTMREYLPAFVAVLLRSRFPPPELTIVKIDETKSEAGTRNITVEGELEDFAKGKAIELLPAVDPCFDSATPFQYLSQVISVDPANRKLKIAELDDLESGKIEKLLAVGGKIRLYLTAADVLEIIPSTPLLDKIYDFLMKGEFTEWQADDADNDGGDDSPKSEPKPTGKKSG